MPRTGSGPYTLPSGYQATTGTAIRSSQHNSPLEDLAAEQNSTRPIQYGGTGASTATAARLALGLGSMAVESTVTTAKIDDLAVTTGKLADDAVTAAKLADNAVVTANITDLNVTTGKIADDAVTLAKQASGTANRLQGFDASGNPSEISVSGATLSGGALTIGSQVDYQAFTGSGTWARPSNYTASSRTFVQIWSGGSGGNSNSSTGEGVGGSGGGYTEFWVATSSLSATESVTVGAGGAINNNGGSSVFAGKTVIGGKKPSSPTVPDVGGYLSPGLSTEAFTGAMGSPMSTAGKDAYYAGASGGGRLSGAGGFSGLGGNGGAPGVAGTAPGGGGGWNAAGARGEVRITTFI